MNTENNEILGLIIEEITRIRTMIKTNSSTINLAVSDLDTCIVGLKKIYEENTSIPQQDGDNGVTYVYVKSDDKLAA